MENIKLNIITDQKIRIETDDFNIDVNGRLPLDGSSMKVNILINGVTVTLKWRGTIDLFEYSHISKHVSRLFEEIDQDQKFLSNTLESLLIALGESLEEHRTQEMLEEDTSGIVEDGSDELDNAAEKEAVTFLQQEDLITNVGEAISCSGIVGNQNTSMAAFLIAISFLLKKPLHGIIQGASCSGKSHILHGVLSLVPQEVLVQATRVTSKSFYNYRDQDLVNKLLVIEDLDGLDEDGEFALREMQSSGFLSSSTVEKSRYRNDLRSKIKKIKTHFSTLATTTNSEIVDDNESRSIILGVDESEEQTQRVVNYQSQKHAGIIDTQREQDTKKELRNVVRKLKSIPVVNPYADKVKLPFTGTILRRLNEQLNYFITAVTLLHQYQRETNDEGKLVTTVKDITEAVEIMFESIILKRDDLDSSTRQFYDELQAFVQLKKKGTASFKFLQREVREYLGRSKANTSKYLRLLTELEYVKATGNANKGFVYEVVYDADMASVRTKVKESLHKQIQEL